MSNPDSDDFVSLLENHARGQVNDDATAQLVDLIQAVVVTGKKGTMNLAVEVKPSGTRMVQIRCDVSSKAPVPDPEVGIFYIDKNGRLQKDDPFQDRLPIEEFNPPVTNVVNVVNEAGTAVTHLDPVDYGRVVDRDTGEITTNPNLSEEES